MCGCARSRKYVLQFNFFQHFYLQILLETLKNLFYMDDHSLKKALFTEICWMNSRDELIDEYLFQKEFLPDPSSDTCESLMEARIACPVNCPAKKCMNNFLRKVRPYLNYQRWNINFSQTWRCSLEALSTATDYSLRSRSGWRMGKQIEYWLQDVLWGIYLASLGEVMMDQRSSDG